MKHKPLSREFLLKRGYCCNNGCKNCPYKKEKEMTNRNRQHKDSELFLFIAFVGMSILIIGMVIGRAI
jgi:hypothetical protein